MKLFLTGATGYVGRVLLHRLLADGHAVEALARPAAGRKLPEHPRLDWLAGDLRDRERVAEATRRADATLHAAAEHAGAQQEADAAATEAFIDGLRGTGKPLVSISATVVYGDTGLVPRAEAGPIETPHPLRVWRIVNDGRIAEGSHGIRGAVIRPPTIYGAGGGPIAMRIAASARAGYAQYVGDGAARWSAVHVFDLVDLCVAILQDEHAAGIFNAASEEVVSRRELAEGIAVTLGLGVPIRSVSLEEGRESWGFLADLGLINQVISSTRASDELGWVACRRAMMSYLRERDYASESVEDVGTSEARG